MDAEGFAMFVHIMAAIVGLMMAAVLHAGLIQIRRAKTLGEMRPWPRVIHLLEPLLPLAAVVLVGTGAWLISLSGGEFRWGDGWLITSIVSLGVVEAFGVALAPKSRKLMRTIEEAPDGPVTPELARLRVDPVVWYTAHFATAVFFGVVFLMSTKPSALWAVVAVVIAAVVGLVSAIPFIRAPVPGLASVEGRAPKAS